MGLMITCSKGCGESIEVTDEMVDEAKKHNSPINVAHEVCPTDPRAPQRRFKIEVIVKEFVMEQQHDADEPHEAVDVLAKMGEEVEAGSYKLALPKLEQSLNEQWDRIVGLADIVDA